MATVTVVGLGSTFFGTTTHADTLDDLHNKQTQIENERSDIKANLSEAEGEIADILIDLEELNKEIDRVDGALKENEKMMTDTENNISDTQKEVDLLEENIVKLEEAIEKRYDILKERIVSYQKSGGNISYLEVVFGAKSFGDFISRVTAVNKIAASDTALMEKQEEDKKEVEAKQNEVIAKLDELKEMKVELEGMQATIMEQKEQNEKKKSTLKTKEKDLLALTEELQIEDSNLASLESEVKQSIATATSPAPSVAQASSNNSNSNLTTLSKKESKKASAKPVVSSGSGNISTAINAGYQYLGVPYVWAGKTPSGFDCSGFVSWAFGQAGISIPSSTSGLSGIGSQVSYSNIQPGDLVFFNTYKTNGHVGIYVGGGKFIGSQNSTGLAVADMTSGYWNDHFAGHVRRVR
ncbi:peptidase [Virgibacillus profundi]|uniref:Peptidase n=2 Tax=Virgibacillus profundi TaxID=2024555 RepID=A0A2A2IAW3_9BACI|nr:peptidase [Virgibacillus profundi]PXY52935.1 peptidase [Virgibacillus profundi]